MPKFIQNNLGKFWIVLVIVFALGMSFLFLKYFSARAQEQINIVPEQVSGTWFNQRAALSQDLAATSESADFTSLNSAYLREIVLWQTEADVSKETSTTTQAESVSFFSRILLGFKSLFQPEVEAQANDCRNGENRACGTETGICQIGVQICEQGVWGKCIGSVSPQPEICDKTDNDCDGQIDEGGVCGGDRAGSFICRAGENKACGTETGVCQIGVQICQDNAWGECIGAKMPDKEICDGVDNDCDGQIDEGGVCGGGGTREVESPVASDTLTFSGFNITPPENKIIKTAQLRLSLAGQGQVGDELIVDYFYQDVWHNVAVFNLENEISNSLNGGYFLYGLPVFEKWADLRDLKVRLTYLSSNAESSSQVYLDAVWLEAEYESKAKPVESSSGGQALIAEKAKFAVKSKKLTWKLDEEPGFEITEASQNVWEKITSVFVKQERSIILIDPRGNDVSGLAVFQGNNIKIAKLEGQGSYRAGLYKLKIIIKEGAKEYVAEQEFAWGVLAINASKSIYLPGETAYLQMAVLRENGGTLCNAPLNLEITSPSSETILLSTYTGTIQYSGECGPTTVTNAPDYFAYYQVREPGLYRLKLTNLTNNFETLDSFEAKDNVPFDVERQGPTRIWPWADYQVTLKIKASQAFSGKVTETLPQGFRASSPDADFQIQDSRHIAWPMVFEAGETKELSYSFDAPDISPYLYLLGPLQIGAFKEARQWQIASDATTQVVLNNTSIISYTIPSDFSASNTIHAIGAGGGGRTHANQGSGGGGGGGYSATSSVELILPGATVTINVPATSTTATNGNNAYFCKDQVDCSAISGTSVIVGANGGSGTNVTTGGAGGITTGAVGGVLYAGGTGGDGNGTGDSGGGGGGAAGPNGIGKTGGSNPTGGGGGGGGGGAGGGSSTVGSNGTTDGGQGGAGPSGLAGTRGSGGSGGAAGGPGNNGGGGGGGDLAAAGGKGGNGTEWSTAGSGGGGGGNGDCGSVAGGTGGLYGGGGGGGCGNTSANGAQGVIVIQYTPDSPPNTPSQDSPSDAETTSTLPVFRMTATDVDPNIPNSDLSYRVAIYSDSGCSSIAQFNDQAVSATGWQGTNSSCVNTDGNTCYNTGTQGVYKTQSALSAGIQYWWKAAAQDPDYSQTFATSSCATFTTEAAGNTAPTITFLTSLHNGVDITIPEWSPGGGTYQASTTFRVQDDDLLADISTTTLFVYRSGIMDTGNCSSTADLNINNCYPSTSSDSVWSPTYGNGSVCARYNTGADFADFWCTTTFYYVAEPTDSLSVPDYSAQTWTAYASTSDLSGAQAVLADSTVDVVTNQAIAIDTDTINYSLFAGNLQPGTNTGSDWVTTTATTTGNVAIDIHFFGSVMTGPGNDIQPSQQRFTTTTLTVYNTGEDFSLTASPGETHDLTMKKPTTTDPSALAADQIYWGIGVPSYQIPGTYTSSNTLTPTSTVASP